MRTKIHGEQILDGTVTGSDIATQTITDNNISNSAGIVDTKLATISTAGKVADSATSATATNTADTIVKRDGSGDFAATRITITAITTGNAATDVANKGYVDGFVTKSPSTTQLMQTQGTGVTALQVQGASGQTADLVQFKNTDGSNTTIIDKFGRLSSSQNVSFTNGLTVNDISGTTATFTGQVQFNPASSLTSIKLKASAGATANSVEFSDASNLINLKISPDGKYVALGAISGLASDPGQNGAIPSNFSVGGTIQAGTPAGITLSNGNNNNIATQDNTYYDINGPTAAFSITGAKRTSTSSDTNKQPFGRLLMFNKSSLHFCSSKHQNASSDAYNRFTLPSDDDLVLGHRESALFQWDGTETGWMLVGVGVNPNSITSVSANTTLNSSHRTVIVTAICTITLPSASTCKGWRYVVKRRTAAAGNVTVAAPAGNTLDGAANKPLGVDYASITVFSDGSNWYVE